MGESNTMEASSDKQVWSLPREYAILPYSIDLHIPGFRAQYTEGDKVLALRYRNCEDWFQEFVDRIVGAVGRTHLPVCRMSDGEFLFWLGEQPLSKRLSFAKRAEGWFKRRLRALSWQRKFEAWTSPEVSSGHYAREEWRTGSEIYGSWIRTISNRGVLALHFEHGSQPFQEHYFPALARRLGEEGIVLNDLNYFPFYFVYALLRGPERVRLLRDRRILLVNGSEGVKREAITRSVYSEGASNVVWCPISPNRSLFSKVDFRKYSGEVDLAVIGAGVGKPRLLCDMDVLQVPCLDGGYVFQVWADRSAEQLRPFCRPDPS
jgi:hypothetical protein